MPGSLSPTLAESAVRLGSWMPFGVAVEMLAHFVHTQVSEPTVTRVTERAGAAYEAVQEAQAARLQAGEGPEEEHGPLLQQVSVDGAFVPLGPAKQLLPDFQAASARQVSAADRGESV